MNSSPLLPVITDKLEPMFNELRKAGISEEATGTIIGTMAQRVMIEILEKFHDSGAVDSDVFDQIMQTDESQEDTVLPKLAQLFQEKTGRDIYEFMQERVDVLNAEFDAAGNE